jgi:hypothetical protein
MIAPFPIVPVDLTDPVHDAFVMKAVAKRAEDWPWTREDDWYLRRVAKLCVEENPRGCVLAMDSESRADGTPRFFGYVLTTRRMVVMAFTKMNYRGPGAFEAPIGTKRDPGMPAICSTLLAHVGFDLKKPTPVLIWSPAATNIAARGYPIYPATPKHRAKEMNHGQESTERNGRGHHGG